MEQNVLEKFKKSVLAICPKLSLEAWQYLESGLVFKSFSNKYFFIQSGVIQKEIGFVTKGLVRGFYVDEKGNEITTLFSKEEEYVTHYSAFITQTPSKYYFQCLEETDFVTLNYQHIQEGYEKFIELERYGRLIAEEVLKVQRTRIESFQFQTAEERYLDFMAHRSDIFQRISLTHLATYLGIERPSLSRIRKRLMKE